MGQTVGDSSSGVCQSRVVYVFLSSLVAIFLGILVFAGSSEAQAVPDFLVEEGNPPPGANVPCEPSAEHPYPVVLVHGTFETMDQNWAVLSPQLKGMGYCVFALNYGNRGVDDIRASALELGIFVDDVLDYTGAEKVSFVGHSQGGMMPRYWIKNLGGKKTVEDLVGIAPFNYGTELGHGRSLASLGIPNRCRSCEQQRAGSRFIRKLNRGDDTPGRGSFTQIASDDDEVIIPFTRSFLRGKKRTENITLQDYNGGLLVTHQNIYNDPFAQKLVFDALDNPGPADPERAFGSVG